jgi:hypothetical protein
MHLQCVLSFHAEIWLQFHAQQRPCDLDSPVIDWERTLTFGHPEHPVCVPLIYHIRQSTMLTTSAPSMPVPRVTSLTINYR